MSISPSSIVLASTFIVLAVHSADAGYMFTPFGPPGAQALGVSGDGKVVVGEDGAGGAFRWTAAGGMENVGPPAGSALSRRAFGVSGNGSIVVGSNWQKSEAFRWTAASGMIGLGDLLGGIFGSQAYGISADGQVIVGQGTIDSGGMAFRWTEADGMQPLGDLPGGDTYSYAYAASQDGSVVVGGSPSTLTDRPEWSEAFRWTEATGIQGLGDLSGGLAGSEAYAVSADGSVIVGAGNSANGPEGFRWTASTGMVGLGDMPGGAFISYAYGVSGDGRRVVGYSGTDNGSEAFVWDSVGGMQNLKALLVASGLDLNGWILWHAQAISTDGTTVVGYGYNPDGQQMAWLATLPPLTSVPEPSAIFIWGVFTILAISLRVRG